MNTRQCVAGERWKRRRFCCLGEVKSFDDGGTCVSVERRPLTVRKCVTDFTLSTQEHLTSTTAHQAPSTPWLIMTIALYTGRIKLYPHSFTSTHLHTDTLLSSTPTIHSDTLLSSTPTTHSDTLLSSTPTIQTTAAWENTWPTCKT